MHINSLVAKLRRWLSGRATQRAPHLELGRRAEEQAAAFLQQQGYRILKKNHRTSLGEIDLLALSADGGTVVVAEVKAGSDSGVAPEVHVNRAKQRKLTLLAQQLAKQRPYADKVIRFDVLAVVVAANGQVVIRHHPNAFEAHE